MIKIILLGLTQSQKDSLNTIFDVENIEDSMFEVKKDFSTFVKDLYETLDSNKHIFKDCLIIPKRADAFPLYDEVYIQKIIG